MRRPVDHDQRPRGQRNRPGEARGARWLRVGAPLRRAAVRAPVEDEGVDAGRDHHEHLDAEKHVVVVAERLRVEEEEARDGHDDEARVGPGEKTSGEGLHRNVAERQPRETQVHHDGGAHEEAERKDVRGLDQRPDVERLEQRDAPRRLPQPREEAFDHGSRPSPPRRIRLDRIRHVARADGLRRVGRVAPHAHEIHLGPRVEHRLGVLRHRGVHRAPPHLDHRPRHPGPVLSAPRPVLHQQQVARFGEHPGRVLDLLPLLVAPRLDLVRPLEVHDHAHRVPVHFGGGLDHRHHELQIVGHRLEGEGVGGVGGAGLEGQERGEHGRANRRPAGSPRSGGLPHAGLRRVPSHFGVSRAREPPITPDSRNRRRDPSCLPGSIHATHHPSTSAGPPK